MSCRIMVCTDDLVMAGSFWRSGGWLSQLIRDYPNEFHWTWYDPNRVASGGIPWTEFRCNDFLFMHRPCLPQHVATMQRAQDLGVKVIVDYDDWLWDIPIDNATYATYAHNEIRNNLDFILRNADIVTTSTRQLRTLLNSIRKRDDDIILAPNALPIEWFDRWREVYAKPKKDETINICWRGSQHHQKDLLHMRDAIVSINNKFDGIKFKFIGWLPWFILNEVPNVFHAVLENPDKNDWENRPSTEVTLYFKNVIDTSPDIVIVPLFDSMFNRAKSSIAWQESMWAGAKTVVAPDWEEWKQPGVLNYKSNDGASFEEVLSQAIVDHKNKKEFDDSGYEKIRKVYSLSKVNTIRYLMLTKGVHAAKSKSQELENLWYQNV